MTVHAFVDESERCRSYLLSVVIVKPHEVGMVRKRLARLLLPGQREIHCHKEKAPRRRQLIDRIAQMPVAVKVYRTATTPRTSEQARQRCLTRAVNNLLAECAHRMVLDTREEQDRHDRATIWRLLRAHPSGANLTFEHVDSAYEPLCWVADAAAWCCGADSDWRRRIKPIIEDEIDL